MEVLTFSQFTAVRGYDVQISHDRLRFPHGISKRQARDNRRAAEHHLSEAFRAARDYNAAIAAGEVRPPTLQESRRSTMLGHPDNESVRAAWRVEIKRLRRLNPTMTVKDTVRISLQSLLPADAEFAVPLTLDGANYVRLTGTRLIATDSAIRELAELSLEQLSDVVDAATQ